MSHGGNHRDQRNHRRKVAGTKEGAEEHRKRKMRRSYTEGSVESRYYENAAGEWVVKPREAR